MQRTFSLLICTMLLLGRFRAMAQVSFEDSLLKEMSGTQPDSQKKKDFYALGDYFLNSNPQKAEQYYTQAFALKMQPEDRYYKYQAEIAACLSKVYSMQNQVAEGRKWLQQAFDLSHKTKDEGARILVNTAASEIYTQSLRYDLAIECIMDNARIFEAKGAVERLSQTYNDLGYVYNRIPLYSKAIFYFHKALANLRLDSARDATARINSFSGLASAYYDTRAYDSSLLYAQKMEQLALQKGDDEIIVTGKLQRSAALLRLNRFQEALDIALEGLKGVEENQITYLLGPYYTVMAAEYAKLGKPVQARSYITKAESFMDTTTASPSEKTDVYDIYADVLASEGNFSKALEYKTKAYEAYRQLRDNEISAQAARSEAMFQAAEKQKQIELLNAVNQKQKVVQYAIAAGLVIALVAAIALWRSYGNKKKLAEVLERSNAEKEVFLKEIHHRVKNNMQIIISLLHMQFKDYKDDAISAELKEAQQRIKSMALVHNKLYESEELVHVHLKSYINDLSEAILASNRPEDKQISVAIKVDAPVNLTLDTAISVGLMLNEVLTNSCKYAFSNVREGNIEISISGNDDQYKLQVHDNGQGFPEHFEQKNSLGLRLVKNLARQLGGNAVFANQPGASVTIFFTEKRAA